VEVEGCRAILVPDAETLRAQRPDKLVVPILVDPDALSLKALAPAALVDAILAKRDLGTRRGMAPLVIALGPGYEAGFEVDAVIETNRGHNLGRVIWEGRAEADTGEPREIAGASYSRVVRAEREGLFHPTSEIGDWVAKEQAIAYIENTYVDFNLYAKIDGIVRGLIREGYHVSPGLKVADVDPRGKRDYCFSVSDKARALGGAVLEALMTKGILP